MAKTANIRLIYFDGKGSAEIARIILASSGKQYEDVRLPSFQSPEWQEMKPNMPLESLPVIEIDGEAYPQSVAIYSYLAREFGLYGKTTKDQFTIDIVVQIQKDINKIHAKWFFLPDGEGKEQAREQARQDTAKFLRYMENLLMKNDNGYFIGNNVSLADIALFDSLTGLNSESLDWDEERYPWINRNKERVMKHWRIGQYINNRKETKF